MNFHVRKIQPPPSATHVNLKLSLTMLLHGKEAINGTFSVMLNDARE